MQKNEASLKILHRIYFGFDGNPDPYEKYLNSWREQLPDFEIKNWNADNLPVALCEFSRLMFSLKDHAFLSDYFRWWVLREYGGIYLDADIEVIKGDKFRRLVDELENSSDYHSFIGIDNKEDGWYTGHSVGSKKGSPLTSFMCQVYENLGSISLWRRKIFYLMSPQITALYFATNGHNVDGMGTSPNLGKPVILAGVKVYPQEYFAPLAPMIRDGVGSFIINAYTSNTSICHHFSCSWHEKDSPYLQGKDIRLMNLAEKVSMNKVQNKKNKIFRIAKAIFLLVKGSRRKIIDIIKNS